MAASNEVKRQLKTLGFRSIFLFGSYVCYLLFGAVTFQCLEYPAREKEVQQSEDQLENDRSQLLNVLWAQTIAKSEEEWMELANERLDLYERSLKDFLARGIDLQEDDKPSRGEDVDNPWTFLGSLFYCFTITTTIGYGNFTPTTAIGKLFTILYASVGIPLTLVLLAAQGRWLTLALKTVLARWYSRMDQSDEFNFTITVAVGLSVLYTSFGIVLFSFVESWSLLNATYFSFVTFATIGLGDFVPLQVGLVLMLMLYTLCGLSMLAMCFTVIQNGLDSWLVDQQTRLGHIWSEILAKLKKSKEKVEQKGEKLSGLPYKLRSGADNLRFRNSRISEAHQEEEVEVEDEDFED